MMRDALVSQEKAKPEENFVEKVTEEIFSPVEVDLEEMNFDEVFDKSNRDAEEIKS
jgi:hypothetical protein